MILVNQLIQKFDTVVENKTQCLQAITLWFSVFQYYTKMSAGEPKPAPALLKDIESGTKLKHAETQEKNPLPSVGGKSWT